VSIYARNYWLLQCAKVAIPSVLSQLFHEHTSPYSGLSISVCDEELCDSVVMWRSNQCQTKATVRRFQMQTLWTRRDELNAGAWELSESCVSQNSGSLEIEQPCVLAQGGGSGVSPPRNFCKLWANLHSEPFPGQNDS